MVKPGLAFSTLKFYKLMNTSFPEDGCIKYNMFAGSTGEIYTKTTGDMERRLGFSTLSMEQACFRQICRSLENHLLSKTITLKCHPREDRHLEGLPQQDG